MIQKRVILTEMECWFSFFFYLVPTKKLPAIVESSKCRFPEWMQGKWERSKIEGSKFTFKDELNQFCTITSRCVMRQNNTPNERFIVHSTTQWYVEMKKNDFESKGKYKLNKLQWRWIIQMCLAEKKESKYFGISILGQIKPNYVRYTLWWQIFPGISMDYTRQWVVCHLWLTIYKSL